MAGTERSVPAAGDKAPLFQLPAHSGSQVSLEGLRGRKVVLYFYPKDDTPGCTIEAKEFRDLAGAFDREDAVILGVSPDSVASHCKFSDKYELNFELLADEDHQVAEAYGAWAQKNMYGKLSWGIQRSTFLIDAQGRIARAWPKVKAEGHAAEVLEAAKAI